MDSSLEVNPEATRLAPSLSQVPPPTELLGLGVSAGMTHKLTGGCWWPSVTSSLTTGTSSLGKGERSGQSSLKNTSRAESSSLRSIDSSETSVGLRHGTCSSPLLLYSFMSCSNW